MQGQCPGGEEMGEVLGVSGLLPLWFHVPPRLGWTECVSWWQAHLTHRYLFRTCFVLGIGLDNFIWGPIQSLKAFHRWHWCPERVSSVPSVLIHSGLTCGAADM